jgi:signal transduction histidine kinase
LPNARRGFHVLVAADGRTLAANLPSWPETAAGSWTEIEADVHAAGLEVDHQALMLDRRLADGARLLIGRDVEDLDDREEVLRDIGVALLLAAILLGTAGGVLMSITVGRRVDAIGAAARSVIAGDLSRRLPAGRGRSDFDRLAATLNLMLERIEALVGSVRRVSDSVAHELRTPLARLHAALAEMEGAEPDQQARLLRAASLEAERLGQVFDAVLRIARIESGRHAAVRRNVDLGALLEDAADYHAPVAQQRGIILETEIAPCLEVTGDPDLLFQAVSNLLDNALKYTPRGGRVRLSGAADGQGARIAVADTGPGIPPEHRARVTERFYRIPETADAGGIGLGLALVSAVAALHESALTFGDAGPGLTVTWVLPR